MNRAEQLITTDEDKTTETEHVRAALKANNSREWMLKIPKKRETANKPYSEHPILYVRNLLKKLTTIFHT
jgi:hypothetical protein